MWEKVIRLRQTEENGQLSRAPARRSFTGARQKKKQTTKRISIIIAAALLAGCGKTRPLKTHHNITVRREVSERDTLLGSATIWSMTAADSAVYFHRFKATAQAGRDLMATGRMPDKGSFDGQLFKPYLPQQLLDIVVKIELLVNGWVILKANPADAYWKPEAVSWAVFGGTTIDDLKSPWTSNFNGEHPPRGLWRLRFLDHVPEYRATSIEPIPMWRDE